MFRLFALLIVASSFAFGQSFSTEEILKRVSDKYAHLSSYRLVAKIEEAQALRGRTSTAEIRRSLTMAPPRFYRAEARVDDRDEIEIANGETIWKVLPKSKVWSKQEVAIRTDDDPEESGSDPGFQSNLISASEQDLIKRYVGLAQLAKEAALLADARIKWNGRKADCFVVKIRIKNRLHQLFIDKESFLVLRHKESSPGGGPDRRPAIEMTTELETFEEEAPAANFSFDAPTDFKQVSDIMFRSESAMSLVGEHAADFSLPRGDGSAFHLADYRGKVVMLDFWATWCPPCRAELPTISKLATKLAGKDVVILGVNDEKGDTGQRYLDEHRFQFATLLDKGGSVHRTYRCHAIPTVIIIDRDGKVSAQYVGARDETELMTALKRAGI